MDEYTSNCNPQAVALAMAKDMLHFPSVIGLTELEKVIDDLFLNVGRLMRVDATIQYHDEHPLNRTYENLYNCTKNSIKNIRDGIIDTNDHQAMEADAKTLAHFRNEFLREREKYLVEQEKKLKKLLFEELSLKEIRSLYDVQENCKG